MIGAGDYLRRLADLPVRSLDEIAGGRGIVVVAPHQDDESLGCGGLIRAATMAGLPVEVVFTSDGAGSHPGSVRFPAARLRELREQEALAALAILGVVEAAVTFLRLPDTAVPTSGPAFDAGVARIEAAVRAIAAGTIFVTWRHDPHCDHAASAIMAEAAASESGVGLMEYPIWGFDLPPDRPLAPMGPAGCRLDVTPWLAAKRRAIAAHRSQITMLIDDDPAGFRLTAAQLARFDTPYETFLAG